YADISCKPIPGTSNIYLNSAADLTIPQRRFGMNPLTGSPFDSPSNVFGGDGGAYLPDPNVGYAFSPPHTPFYLYQSGYPSYADINYLMNSMAGLYYSPPIAYGSLAGSDILVNDVI